jgi:hypothetical protein
MKIFEKTYDGESIADIDRDVSECFDAQYNSVMVNIPTNKDGFHKGSFVVTVEWIPED